MPHIQSVRATPLDVELTEPFGIATGLQPMASNVLVELVLDDGTLGLGEAAPFPAVSGETQALALGALRGAREAIVGLAIDDEQRAAAVLAEALGHVPSALAGAEIALFDARSRSAGISLWRHFGGAESVLTSDITVTTGDAEHAARSARLAVERGFETLKIKIGGAPLVHDLERLRAITRAAPAARWVLDANASLSADEAVELVRMLGSDANRIALFEQPVARDDLDGLRRVRETCRLLVAADESARDVADVKRLAAARAVDVVNLKVAKSGVSGALAMLDAARAAGFGTMIGAMVETWLGISASACLAAGRGGFAFVDLDTAWFMKAAPLTGGCIDECPRLGMRGDAAALGHGVRKVDKDAVE